MRAPARLGLALAALLLSASLASAQSELALRERGWHEKRSPKQWAQRLIATDSAPLLEALAALRAYGPIATEELWPLIRGILADANPTHQMAAAEALAELGDDSEPLRRYLVGALESEAPGLRRRAAACLGDLGAAPLDAPGDLVSALIGCLEDEDWAVRLTALDALRRFQAAAVPALTAALKDAALPDRAHLPLVLADIGAAAKVAIPELVEALRAEDWRLRATAAEALGRLRAGEARSSLEALLKDPQEVVRAAAKEALAALSK